ncbi:MAG: S41 family peptidase [Thalassolituus oleivorans]|jgi:carboxyl-terminal processing protease|uniref:S41 family peptidase n=1 Tax=Thalassolituus TaxID=187492 RepID=UPI001B57FEAB|nr:S41 family peptidase [Thalassolituus oleivorans]MBQ0728739.1 S41 family peptidase [Thalassolituus oleivorans]MBQ0780517.1 S41 family peptidase [Thalassolituus oleivorans]MDF1641180.1 S41 family peptidase [Thalassolituus oleivorans]
MLPKHLLRPILFSLGCTLAFQAGAETADDTSTPEQVKAATTLQGQLPLQELRNFTEIFERIRSAYVEEIDDKTLFDYAIKGMLTSLDPHSAYLQEDAFTDLQETTSGKFGGLGIEVGMENGLIRVITPIDDTPAEKAGIRAGDFIVTLDDEPVMGLTLSEAVERMRGEPGSKISLEVRRGDENELLSFTLERAEIKVASVRTEMMSGDIGYVRITQFQEHTGAELKKALQKWTEDGQLNGLILDLRNNPGGVLDAAVDVVDAFISSGVIVYTKGRNPQSELRFEATADTVAGDIPVVVLINGGSASASEIVAGALQDHKRAVIVGTQSFGKGSVQSVLPLTETSAVKLTTARYFTPNDRSIQAQGIVPDILVEQSEVTPYEERYYKESDLPGHLSNPTVKAKNDVSEKTSATKESASEKKDSGLLKKDFQLYEAHTLLRGVSILSPVRVNASEG